MSLVVWERNNPWTSCQLAAGRRQDWALRLVRMRAPLRRVGTVNQHGVMEEEKKLPAELGIPGTAQRRVVMARSRDYWWLSNAWICQIRLKHPHSPLFASFCCFPGREVLLGTWFLPKCFDKHLAYVFLFISLCDHYSRKCQATPLILVLNFTKWRVEKIKKNTSKKDVFELLEKFSITKAWILLISMYMNYLYIEAYNVL